MFATTRSGASGRSFYGASRNARGDIESDADTEHPESPVRGGETISTTRTDESGEMLTILRNLQL